MKMLIRAYLIIFFILTSLNISAQSNKPSFRLKDLRRLVRLSSPRISPDGRKIAVIVSRPNWKKDKNNQEIDLLNISSGQMRKITYKREGLSEIRWSPDSKLLAFIAKDTGTKKSQIFVMPMNGGDPIMITKSKTGVNEYAWSPDGKKIAFAAQDTIPNPKAIKHHKDVFRVTDNNFTVRAVAQPWHLWLVPVKGGKPKRLTQGTWSVNTDQESISPLTWNSDGKLLAFQKFPDVWYGNSWHSVIAEVDTGGKKVSTVIKDEGSGHPMYSPSGSMLAFIRARNGDLNNGNAVYVNINGKFTDITKELARNINHFAWLPDSKTMLLTGEKGTRTVLWRQPLNGKAQQLNVGNITGIRGLSISQNGKIAFTAATADHPYELYVMKSVNGKPKLLTNFNSFIDSLKLGKAENINWKGHDGFSEDGVLIYPADYKPGKKYPLVLVIHGGPEGASTVSFSTLPQLLSAHGFFVFQPNYRGSINLGDAYQHAIFRDTGEGPGKDIMAGLKKVEQLGIIDTNRIGVSGWSYGGYMTSWLNGNYPDKWKAALEGAALNDWVMDYTISFYQTYDLYFFGGSPWIKKYWKIWREQSPIIFASKVKAPTLILGDVGDQNVPIINSYQMYHALLDNGVHTEFYAYPVNTHFPHDIVRTTDIYKRWIDWMEKYVK